MRSTASSIRRSASGTLSARFARWWARAGECLVRWGEQSHHHRMGSWTRRPWH